MVHSDVDWTDVARAAFGLTGRPLLFILGTFALLALAIVLLKWGARSLGEALGRGRALAARRTANLLDGSPTDFERLCVELFRAQGYAVRRTGGQSDGGVDLVAKRGEERIVAQCKCRRDRKVGVQTVRELLGVVTAEHAAEGVLITTRQFARGAQDFARGQPLRLMDREALVRAVQRYLPDTLTAEPPAPAQVLPGPPSPRSSPSAMRPRWPITCAQCGQPDTVPFRPSPNRSYLCRSCDENRLQSPTD